MARFGINPRNTLGIPIPLLRRIAREHGRDHDLAASLWCTDIHEAKIVASLVGDPRRLTARQMDQWAGEFDSWDVCDQCCANLFEDSLLAWPKALAWSRKKKEFMKRAGFVLMARLAVSSKEADDSAFQSFFERIEAESSDDRPMVRKAVNWALRQIGKRNSLLQQQALAVADRLRSRPDRSSRWIGSDAARELRGTTAKKIIEGHERKRGK